MKTPFDRINEMKAEIIEIAHKEASNLFRIARSAEAHGASEKLVQEIREEAWILENEIYHYPDRLLDWKYPYRTKHAFRY